MALMDEQINKFRGILYKIPYTMKKIEFDLSYQVSGDGTIIDTWIVKYWTGETWEEIVRNDDSFNEAMEELSDLLDRLKK